jgi:hypothetical protein
VGGGFFPLSPDRPRTDAASIIAMIPALIAFGSEGHAALITSSSGSVCAARCPCAVSEAADLRNRLDCKGFALVVPWF